LAGEVAARPSWHERPPDQAERHRGHGRRKHRCRCADRRLSEHHNRKRRHKVQERTAGRNDSRGHGNCHPFPPNPIDQGADRRLGKDRPDLRCRQSNPDSTRVPMMMFAQECSQKRAHAIAHVGQKEIQAIKRPQASRRRPPLA
jgi:hypothetical protein